jgi:GT2 family glycosyltransferase
MKISVVVLNWNRAGDTVTAVRSVLAQRNADFDVLVWDNASTDTSREELETAFGKEERVALHFADANYGVAGGRNRAFRRVDGDALLSLDNDAYFERSNALQMIAEAMLKQPDIGAVSFEVKRPDGHLMWPFSRPAATWRQRSFETIRVDGCAFAVRRDAFEEAGGFAEHFSPYGTEDQHFAFKLIGHGYRILYFPAVVVVHAFSPAGRHPTQFAMHVRNCIWMCMELFPMPRAAVSSLAYAARLGKDALENHLVAAYLRGVFTAIVGFKLRRRDPVGRGPWAHIRALMEEDKRLAR